jgi:endonuclease-3
MLSSRTRDTNTTAAAERLFNVARTPQDICKLSVGKIMDLIKPVGFYRIKAKRLKEMCRIISEKYNGKVPTDIKKLMMLPGVGLKTANIVMARAFNEDIIGVDTHVHRISNRLGIVSTKTPEETSKLLNRMIPKKYRRSFNRIMVGFGQVMCLPIKPKCNICPLNTVCYKTGIKS